MLENKKIIVVMPAYNAALTLKATYREIPADIVDEVILIDDCSQDDTVAVANALGIRHIIRHDKNMGYGGNQKTCYNTALHLGADVVIMLHPDYQYTPKLIRSMASLITEGVFDCVLGSRILGSGAIKGGMPYHKYIANRFLTAFQNLMLGYKLSEYHTGYRAFSKSILENLPLNQNANGFLFDNQMLLQIIYAGYAIGEITCPTRYEAGSSSINFIDASKYGLGVIATTIEYIAHKKGLRSSRLFLALDDNINSDDQ
ncbi:MAG: glycosyltransferase family 2 protein [Thiohalomonadales bacterium]